jgi:hypothetical protein
MPEEKIRNYRIDKFIGRSDLMVLDQASHEVVIRVNGQIVSPTNGYIPLWEGSESLSIQIINTNSSSGGVLSPYKFKIIGYIKR